MGFIGSSARNLAHARWVVSFLTRPLNPLEAEVLPKVKRTNDFVFIPTTPWSLTTYFGQAKDAEYVARSKIQFERHTKSIELFS